MARPLRYMTTCVFLLAVPSARANFVLHPVQSGLAGPDFVNPAASGNPAASRIVNNDEPVHWKMAYGFGDNIPLSFACRQIIPPAVKVTYGAGVNAASPVTWKGGDTWNHVLRDTIKPLGLHLQMSYLAVSIVK